MATEKVIAAKLSLDTGDSTAKLKTFNTEVDKTQANLAETGKAATKTSESVAGAGSSFGNLRDKLTSIPGPVGQAAQGVTGLGTAFKALLANPVGLVLAAIVATLALLYKAFTNTFEGAQKVEQIFAGLKAAGQALFDNLDKVASAITKLFQFDFSGAIDDIKSVTDAATGAFTAMSDLTKEAQELHKEQLANDLDQAKRFDRLAQLREKLADQDESPAEKKAAALELKKEAEINAKDDLDLAARTAKNKIAILSLGKDGAKKNQDEINQIEIEQIKNATDNANELRRINKLIAVSDREIQTQRREQEKAAADAAKAEREKLVEFNNKLTKLQQDNELATLTDSYAKELKALENKIAEDKRQNELARLDKKITRDQADQLNAALDIQANLQRNAITDKHNEELRKKEADFQKELAKISSDTQLKGITDARQLERVQLQIGYEEKLQDAITRYKDDATKLQAVKIALDDQLRVEQAAIDEKNRVDDEKKKLAGIEAGTDAVLSDPLASFKIKKEALDLEVQATREAFDARAISEEEFTQKTKAQSETRKALDVAEKEARMSTFGAIGNAFSQLSNLIGQKTAAGKAFAVAAATIAAIQSAVSSFNSLSGIPIVGPALGAVAAAAAIAAGIANVKKIVAVQVPGQAGGGGGSVPTPITPTAPIAPSQGSTNLSPTTIGQLKTNTEPLRAYTLEAEGTGVSERQKRLQRASVLGG